MSRANKTDVRVAAFGDVDEANSAIGVALALGDLGPDGADLLRSVQNDLFDVGADLCTPIVPDPKWATLRVDDSYVERLESACDTYNADLPPLDSFVLPGGTPGSALLHVARTVTRRAERSTWALLQEDPDRTNPTAATYLNRLSDLLFILARAASISSASSTTSARTETVSRVTERKPPCTAATSSSPSVRLMRTGLSTSTPSIGSWLGRMPMSPSVVRAITISASPVQILRSGATSSTFIVATQRILAVARSRPYSGC
jgi:cob(I)alamin adenosyltransferase